MKLFLMRYEIVMTHNYIEHFNNCLLPSIFVYLPLFIHVSDTIYAARPSSIHLVFGVVRIKDFRSS